MQDHPSSLVINELHIDGYQKVIEAKDPACKLHCMIAIHNTTLGPSLGGMRIKPYPSANEALQDVLNLAKAMTYKSAIAKDGLGGGKSVVIAKPEDKSEQLLLTFGRVVDSLGGAYIVAEDVGTTPEDMAIIRRVTPYVAALPTDRSSGDPSRFTAWGVYKGIQAVAQTLWGTRSVAKRLIAIQGLGHVGSKLADLLFWEGANLILSDVDQETLHRLQVLYGAQTVSPEAFCGIECDILAPCALGGIINSTSIQTMKCKAIAGAANNQLAKSCHGKELLDAGILYAPDYIINSGGIINAATEFHIHGYNPKTARDNVNHIYYVLKNVFGKSLEEHRPTSDIADELAEYNLAHLVGKRMHPIKWGR